MILSAMVAKQRAWWIGLAIASAITAMVLQLRATGKFGIGLAPDSTMYVQGARQLIASHHFAYIRPGQPDATSPIIWYPPAWSVVLSTAGLFHADVIIYARYVCAALFAIAMTLAVVLIGRLTRSVVFTAIAMFVVVGGRDQLEIFCSLLSEPMFLVTSLAALLAMAEYLRGGESTTRFRWLIACAAAVSLGAMTRYLGMVLIPFGLLIIATQRAATFKRRAIDGVLFGAVSIAANLAWAARNHAVGGATGRAAAWHPANAQHLITACQTFARWLLPLPARTDQPSFAWPLALGLAAFIVATWILAIYRHQREGTRDPLVRVLAWFVPLYFLGLLAAISTIDAAAPTDYRLLSPIYLPAIALTAWAAKTLWSDRRPGIAWTARIGLSAICVLMIVSNFARTPNWISRARKLGEGLGYASRRWQDSRTMRALHRIPMSQPTYTNATDATYLRAGRADSLLPPKYDRSGTQLLPEYASTIQKIRDTIEQRRGAVIIFSGILRRGMPTTDDLDHDLAGLKKIVFTNDATIYAHPLTAKKLMEGLSMPSTRKSRVATKPTK